LSGVNWDTRPWAALRRISSFSGKVLVDLDKLGVDVDGFTTPLLGGGLVERHGECVHGRVNYILFASQSFRKIREAVIGRIVSN
jgi:hypothetical protein